MSRHSKPRDSRPNGGRRIALATGTVTALAVMLTFGVLSAVSFARPDHSSAPPTEARMFISIVADTRSLAPHPVLTANDFSGPQSVKAKPGDTLSSVAAKVLGSPKRWPILWWDNQAKVPNPNALTAGTRLSFGAWHHVRPWLSKRALAAIPKPAPAPVKATPVSTTTVAAEPASAPQAATFSGSGFQACVIAAESGGNPRIMNSTGHYGLYQFSYGTWVSYGGAGGDFGHASVSEQNQVFDNAMATPGGNMNWSPYDGCWP